MNARTHPNTEDDMKNSSTASEGGQHHGNRS